MPLDVSESNFSSPLPPDYRLVPAQEIRHRLQRAQQALDDNDLTGLLILQKIDLFYFTGTLQNGILWLPATGEPVFWVRHSLVRARQESPLSDIRPHPSSPALKKELSAAISVPCRIGLELDTIPANRASRLQELLPTGCQTSDASFLIRSLRAIKSEYEIECIRRAAAIMDELFDKVVPSLLAPGKSEFEILGELDLEARKRGHLGIIRMRGWNNEVLLGHILSGPESTRRGYLDAPTNGLGLAPAFPQGASRTKIRPGVPVSIDFMVNYEGYMADATRVFCLGEPSPLYIKTHHKLLDLNQKITEALRPGQSSTELFQLALEIAGEFGFAENFLGYGDDRVSFVGHGIGLEVDEFPFIASGTPFVLTAGMVIALEPKLIFPPHQQIPAPLPSGVVAIESTYLITNQKPLRLNRFPEKIRTLSERD